ncbi:hypothetical protein BDZ94DRAFT_1326526 [Collybia nuda]|uniref:Ino eighty subunit 1 n=1 Tax=Collybia nuda TaxID=64659 RepID=A0A9P5XWQ3_9AGAR|nr:hypothetical protein BDZ94DRAFT_1326526 [Collybia nuda]
MSSQRPSPAIGPGKRTIALKRVDGEPLTRVDIQYDVLHTIFHDNHAVFTDPYPSHDKSPIKVSFHDLYLKTLLHSPKATRALKDKMNDSLAFAEDFAMLALLVNVGRVNTTMSFFPEMKTAIRTYHPIPALQRTAGNLQDAPRIKHILKSSLLEAEQDNAPTTPADILAHVASGRIPSTTIMNLIFVLANHSAPIGSAHFTENLDFIDLFLRKDVSSVSRGRAFLWLCYHYLEVPSTNNDDDYDDEGLANPFADQRRGNTPTFIFLSETEVAQENVDPEDEKTLAEKLVAQRAEKLRIQGTKESNKDKSLSKPLVVGSVVGDEEDRAIANTEENKPKGKRGTAKAKASLVVKEKKATTEKPPRSRLIETLHETGFPLFRSDDEYDVYSSQRVVGGARNQYPRRQPQHQDEPQADLRSPYHKISAITPESPSIHHSKRHRYSPYVRSPTIYDKYLNKSYRPRPPAPSRSMLQQAWHLITTTDPLMDSDDEIGDEYTRHDCIQRLRVITSLRHKEPTPEPE